MSSHLLIVILVVVCAGGVVYALAYPWLAGSARAERRQKAVIKADPKARLRNREVQSRRSQVAESLKELEQRQKRQSRPPLSVRLSQAGLSISKTQFYLYSVVGGILVAALAFFLHANRWVLLAAFFVGVLGLPRWVLGYLIKRRRNRFLDEFPNAIDVIVRGVRAGLPLADSIRTVASDAQEPVRGEFRAIMDAQAIGLPLADAVARLTERVGLPEANFFSIVVAIQAKSGGSLSDALSNLSRVLRERRKMKGKVKAMSTEAKSSAGIIGSLPIIVGFLVYLTSPDYISLLWHTKTGWILLGISGLWMLMGILVMRRMINFEI
ncbi:MAG TPA: type II secretion system F family protein [Hyphomicrobiales bacterium]|nr:type II secretion system F family protein [Hyphomicrobiales bacterium]